MLYQASIFSASIGKYYHDQKEIFLCNEGRISFWNRNYYMSDSYKYIALYYIFVSLIF